MVQSKYPAEPRTDCGLFAINVTLDAFFAGKFAKSGNTVRIASRKCAEWHNNDELCLEGKKQKLCGYKFDKKDVRERPSNFTYGGGVNV